MSEPRILTAVASGTSAGYIRWVSVAERLPDHRRGVLAWGAADWLFGLWKRDHRFFLGVTKYSPATGDRRGHFECEQLGPYSLVICRVTHWAEIVGPR